MQLVFVVCSMCNNFCSEANRAYGFNGMTPLYAGDPRIISKGNEWICSDCMNVNISKARPPSV